MGYNFADHCYILENGLWSQFAKMSEKRRNLASVSLTRNGKNALFVTGGRDDDIYQKQTTEFIYSNGDVEQGPDLPGISQKRIIYCLIYSIGISHPSSQSGSI